MIDQGLKQMANPLEQARSYEGISGSAVGNVARLVLLHIDCLRTSYADQITGLSTGLRPVPRRLTAFQQWSPEMRRTGVKPRRIEKACMCASL